jgi:ABC-type polar amino acid transport system ATPase subunit
MPRAVIKLSSKIDRSPRVMQVSGIFDLPPAQASTVELNVDIPIEKKDWNVGLIVGPSGCGKSSIARHFWPDQVVNEFKWGKSASVIDGFPKAMGAKEITMLLSSIGFSSPPAWLRPYDVLSTGEKFRVSMARALAEMPELSVIDEFTSVVDRTVAKIGSAAIAKAVRRRKAKMIAVTCHYDVEDWLQPDWIYCPAEQRFAWREHRQRPAIDLTIRRINREAWKIFAPHHYLTADLSPSATCFGGYVDDRLVAFHSYMPFVGRLAYGKAWRGHRSVVLPDFQGASIGHAMITECARIVGGWGYRVFRNSGHPAEIAAAMRDPNWAMIRPPSRNASDSGGLKRSDGGSRSMSRATHRLTASFEFRGDRLPHKIADPFREAP